MNPTDKNLCKLLGIEFPLIMAPMFLVTNKALLEAGIRSGVMAVFPSLNFRKDAELTALLDELNACRDRHQGGSYGVNLIVQQSNIYLKQHLAMCVEKKVPFYITSLGNPREVIKAAHHYGAKVFCDITNMEHAQKCYSEGCDGFIAVGQGAGGHAGPNPLQVLLPALKEKFPDIPLVAAGGITGGRGLLSVQVLGADGVSVGTRFIASTECQVNEAYKKGIVDAGMDDIVMTTRLSGTPCTIINTSAAKKMGYEQNILEKFLSRRPRLKKWFKMFIQLRGMKKLEQSVLPNNYLQLWCAGKSAELIHDILPCEEIIRRFKKEYELAVEEVKNARHV